MKSKLLLSSFLLFIVFCFADVARAQAVNTNDSLALVDLYNSTNGPFWTRHQNWLKLKPVSSWYGVTVTGTRVTNLSLAGNNLSGSLPVSIGNLTALTGLNLQSNFLTGDIPSTIGNLVLLTSLTAAGNRLTSLPSSVGQLSLLTFLDISSNKLTGSIPDSVTQLIALTDLRLNNNQLTGSIPFAIGNLINLTNLQLHDNNLSGGIPASFTSLSKLVTVDATFNKLSGTIPTDIGKLDSLQLLYFGVNQLTGSIPSSIGNLHNLQAVDLTSNQLTGSIPGTISRLSNLTELQVENNQLSGTLPASIGNLSKLLILSFANNQFTGSIPAAYGKLSSLSGLDVSTNQLTGSVPAAIIKLPVLNSFIAYHNQLTDSGNLSSLKETFPNLTVSIGYNRFTFNTLQYVAQNIPRSAYTPQAPLPIHQYNNKLAVSAGGTLSKNTYTWYLVGQAAGTSFTGDSTYKPAQSGSYYATITNSIATAVTLTTDTVTYTSAAIKNKPIAKTVTVYPNPVRGVLSIYGLDANSNCKITVADINGTVRMTNTARQQSTAKYEVNNLKPGHYVLSVNNGQTLVSVPFIKE